MHKIKVAFVQKNWEENLGVLWISSVLKKYDFSTRIFIEEKWTYKELLKYAPDIVGYSCITGEQKWVIASIKKAKDIGLYSLFIVGGPHPTFFPSFVKNKEVDAICRGEGEYAMLELAQALEEGREPYHIKNFFFNVTNQIIENELRPLISDLDSIPFPDRSFYSRYKFLASNPYKIFITSRGCPFQCTFCFNHVLHRLYGKPSRYIRRRSVDNIVNELLEVKRKWGIKEIRFSDDHFALDVKWLRDLTTIYKKEVKKPYTINARADVLDEERIVLLKESGCRLVCFGIETGREKLRNKVLKKNISDEQLVKAANLLKKYKIKFLTSNIIGLPNETVEDAWITIKMNQKLRTDLPWFSMMQYYPGTQIYKQAKEEGLLDNNYDLNKMGSYFKNDYLMQNNINELQNIHSFSILVSRYKYLGHISKTLTKRFKPNIIFKIVFQLSYLHLTIKRANFSFLRLIQGSRYYLSKIFG